MSEKVTTSVLPHIKAGSFVDEQVDQFDAFAMSWNGDEAIHLTFGRNSINLKSTKFVVENGVSGIEAGEIEPFRLDVAAVAMPIGVAKELAETLSRMIAHAEERRNKGE
ncbi:hypothetical protein [Pseudomonas sp. ACM7]|uniref:hypothetical protein n=1 Tax=Pseudomonas sp. ACM7 TaxID=2052956 RepID=UPI001012B2FD|nr:hypothetical protein [Pseudomonas sp. ACM7]QAY93678.1 hypothetical protein CUN63_29405 [Pseudomonas sp. ACM7]